MAQWTDVYFLPEALCGNEFLWAQNILDSSLIKSQVKTKYLFFFFLEEILGSYLHKDFWDWKMLGYQ